MKKIKKFIKTYFLITGIGANIYILWILLGLPFCFDRLLIKSECPVRGEYIVCLGGGISANSLPTDEGWQCIYTAVQLYFDGYGKKIIFTGGGTEKITEAEVYAEAAQWLGCPEEALAFDPTPSSTAEHALNMLELKIPKVTKEDTLNIVTSPLHTRRTAMCFKKKGFMRLRMVTSYSSKREDPRIVRNLRTSKFAAYHPSEKSYGDMFNRLKWRSSYFFAALREVVAIAWYWVKGYV